MNESDTEMNERDTDMDANESESENENENELNSTAQQNASGSVLTQQSILGNKNLDQSAQKKESAKHSKCLVM
jgi:hypothetical protein